MARKRYTEEQIIGVLNEAEAGAKTGELCRSHGMSEGTFYKWKAKYAGLTLNELKRLSRNYPYQTAWVQARYHPRREPS